MQKRVALYARVSTDQQSVDMQVNDLLSVARARGYEVVGTYIDHGISGAKGRDRRPEFDRLHKDAVRGKFDIVMAWAVDRLGRSLQDLVAFLAEIDAAHVGLYLHQQALDTTTPAGRALFGMLGVFSEFERAISGARVRTGMQHARLHGTKSGKPFGRPPLPEMKAQAIRADLLVPGRRGIQAIARDHGVGTGTVQRIAATLFGSPTG